MYFTYRSAIPRSVAEQRWLDTPSSKSSEFLGFRKIDYDTVYHFRDVHILDHSCFTTDYCIRCKKTLFTSFITCEGLTRNPCESDNPSSLMILTRDFWKRIIRTHTLQRNRPQNAQPSIGMRSQKKTNYEHLQSLAKPKMPTLRSFKPPHCQPLRDNDFNACSKSL